MSGVYIQDCGKEQIEEVFKWARIGANNALIGYYQDPVEMPDGAYLIRDGNVYAVDWAYAWKPTKTVNIFTGDVHYPSNAERIKHMTDEELENFLGLVSWEDEPWCEYRRDCDENMKCRECLREWLKQEAAEDES